MVGLSLQPTSASWDTVAHITVSLWLPYYSGELDDVSSSSLYSHAMLAWEYHAIGDTSEHMGCARRVSLPLAPHVLEDM